MLMLLFGCKKSEVELGDFVVSFDDATFSITHPTMELADVELLSGSGTVDTTMSFGAFRFDDEDKRIRPAGGFGRIRGKEGPLVLEVEDGSGEPLGTLVITQNAASSLLVDYTAEGANLVGLGAACTPDDHFLGLGGHAMDVDHVGQAFSLWVQEPGIGKSEDESLPEDWPVGGTRHAASYPVPFLHRPHARHALLFDADGRVDVDLCATDPDRFEAVAWQRTTAHFVVFAGGPVDVLQQLSDYNGRAALPQPWVFTPWNDAVRGPERVRAVADRLRDYDAPSSVIWSEDWKGAEEEFNGYHLTGEWFLDEEKYPGAKQLAKQLEDDGFKWFAYFSPFLFEGTKTWDEALQADVILRDDTGEPYTFPGATFTATSLVDLSVASGRTFVAERMRAAVDIGFDGWMADFAEWLPTDAALRSTDDAAEAHNHYPEWWQETNRDFVADQDLAFFVRSGWTRTASLVPVVWAGDQRTSFDADDGLPTVVAMGLGMGASGVPVFTHDVAGYQSVGNPPTTKELWFRWASLGAYTPVMRTHHGAFDTDNWQFDSDDETTEHWAAMAREHMRLFPYRYGLAWKAFERGTPMILPPAYVAGGEDWGRSDAWMLGDALLVAPVMEKGADGRDVELPPGDWFEWTSRKPAQSGFQDAGPTEIPVFARGGTTVPTFATIPMTGVEGTDLLDLDDVDGERIVYLFGDGGRFREADGTVYEPRGSATGADEVTETLRSGDVEVGGLTVEVDGPVERTYTFVVVR